MAMDTKVIEPGYIVTWRDQLVLVTTGGSNPAITMNGSLAAYFTQVDDVETIGNYICISGPLQDNVVAGSEYGFVIANPANGTVYSGSVRGR